MKNLRSRVFTRIKKYRMRSRTMMIRIHKINKIRIREERDKVNRYMLV